MRPHVVALLALSGFLLLPIQSNGQDKDSTDKPWPSLGGDRGSNEEFIRADRPRFIIDSRKLQRAPDKSTPSWAPRCITSPFDCAISGAIHNTRCFMFIKAARRVLRCGSCV